MDSLARTLESFISQDYPEDRYEIIVSDNNSSDNTAKVIDEYSKKFSHVKRFFERRQGVHYARNSAAKRAKGELLYFTDDDMIAAPNLLQKIAGVFTLEPSVAVATGKVLPEWETEPPKWILELCYNGTLSLNDQGDKTFVADLDPGVWSCHQAVKKDVFLKAGGFNPENTRGEWVGDGETGLNLKIKKLGYRFAYVGESLTYHYIPASRMTQKYLNKRYANQGNCDSYTLYRERRFSNLLLMLQIMKHLSEMGKHLFNFLFRLIRGTNAWRLSIARIYYNINRVKYDFRLLSDGNWRDLVLKDNWLED